MERLYGIIVDVRPTSITGLGHEMTEENEETIKADTPYGVQTRTHVAAAILALPCRRMASSWILAP